MKHLLTGLLLCYSLISWSQSYQINGYIRDGKSGEALPYASCFDTLNHIGASANARGYFSFSLPGGPTALKASFSGYKNFQLALA